MSKADQSTLASSHTATSASAPADASAARSSGQPSSRSSASGLAAKTSLGARPVTPRRLRRVRRRRRRGQLEPGVGRDVVVRRRGAAVLEPVGDDDLDRPGDGDRRERAEHAGHLGAHEHGHENGQRRQLHGAPVDDRLEQVVLDLLVDDEEDEHDDRRGHRVGQRHERHDDRSERRAGERDEVEDRHEEPEREGERNADDEQHDRGEEPRDHADEQVAGDVAADRLGDLARHPVRARLRPMWQERDEAGAPCLALEQHEEGHEEDRHDPRDERDDAARHVERRGRPAGEAAGPVSLDRLLYALDDVVLRLEEPERSAPVREVADVVRRLVDKRVDLVDERRDEQRAEPRDDRDHDQVDDRRGGPAPAESAALERIDGRTEGDRQERRHERPDEHAPRHPDDPQHDRHAHDEQRDRHHGAGAEGDDALVGRGHTGGIARASGGPNACQGARSHTRRRPRRPRSSVRKRGGVMSETTKKERPAIVVRAVTAWDGDRGTVFDPATLAVRMGPTRSFDALSRNAPVWVDMDLKCETATEWLEPWDAPAAGTVDWSDLGSLAGRLKFHLPSRAEPDDPVATALERLPTLNEMAVLRWIGQRLEQLGTEHVVAPLVGCLPTCKLKDVDLAPKIDLDPARTGPLELVLLRVNLVVIERFIFTVRLPDRLCTGGPLLKDGRRIPAEVRVPPEKRPNLTVFTHHLPDGGRPTPREVADALALYLLATCWSAAEHGRRRLITIERAAKPDGVTPADCDGVLFEHMERAFQLGAALEVFEEELLRVQQRLSEAPDTATYLPTAVGARYERALAELRTVQRDIRTGVDSLNTLLVQVQREQARSREARQTRVQLVLGAFGTLVVIPSLVVALFSDDAKFGGTHLTLGITVIASVVVGMLAVLLAMTVRRTAPPARDDDADDAGPRRASPPVGLGAEPAGELTHAPA